MSLRTHLVLLSLLCLAGIGVANIAWMTPIGVSDTRPPATDSIAASLGRPMGEDFSLVDHHGRAVTARDFAGKTRLVFFGFTHCPDVCPTGLSRMSLLLEELGEQAGGVHALFITVDPERDTPEVIKDYVSNFAGKIVGLTGTQEQIAAVAKSFHAYFKKAPQPDGGYLVDHSASILVLDSNGNFRATIDIHEDPSAALQKVRRLIRGSGSHKKQRRRRDARSRKPAGSAIGPMEPKRDLCSVTSETGAIEDDGGLGSRLQEVISTCVPSRVFDAELVTLGRRFLWMWQDSRKESFSMQKAKHEFNGGARRLWTFMEWYQQLPDDLAQRFAADLSARSPRGALAALKRLRIPQPGEARVRSGGSRPQPEPYPMEIRSALASLLKSWLDHLVHLSATSSGVRRGTEAKAVLLLCNGVADLCGRGLGFAFEGSPKKETPCRTLLLGLTHAIDPTIPATTVDAAMQSIKWDLRRRQRARHRSDDESAARGNREDVIKR